MKLHHESNESVASFIYSPSFDSFFEIKNPTAKATMLAKNKGTEMFKFTPQRIANGEVTTNAIMPHTVAFG